MGGGVGEWEGVVDLGRGGGFYDNNPFKNEWTQKNQIDIKIDNFSQKGLSSSGEILRSTFSMIKKKIHRSRVILVFDLRVPNLTKLSNP